MQGMKWFSDQFIEFFKELSVNNNKQWFDVHRTVYEQEVKKPFALFVQEMILRIQQDDSTVKIRPADAIMRINNDIRFSKDKSPYKLHVGANISARGKRDLAYPGLYFELAADAIRMYGGSYMPDKEQLLKIREQIAANPSEFKQAYQHDLFRDKFSELLGEKNKRLPEPFNQLMQSEPLIANKQFYYGAEISADWITSPALPEKIMEYYYAGKPVCDFLKESFE
jgi:uncharacterized protein (TIGR02453 family)